MIPSYTKKDLEALERELQHSERRLQDEVPVMERRSFQERLKEAMNIKQQG